MYKSSVASASFDIHTRTLTLTYKHARNYVTVQIDHLKLLFTLTPFISFFTSIKNIASVHDYRFFFATLRKRIPKKIGHAKSVLT